MAGTIKGRNTRARQAAAKAGRLTFQKEIVDYWPSCVECGHTIRSRGMQKYRCCACPGKQWTCNSEGWVALNAYV